MTIYEGDVVLCDPSKIDSTCEATAFDADAPSTSKCGRDAVTWAFKRSGHRLYLCRDHAESFANQANQSGVDAGDLWGDHAPKVDVCDGCGDLRRPAVLLPDGRCAECQT